MPEIIIDHDRLKAAVKEALLELLEERKDDLTDWFNEAAEEAILTRFEEFDGDSETDLSGFQGVIGEA